ncbi:glutamate racemase [Thiospirochaeta perfilievii]|uniref:Glutamate racemase n=1 Tax=Thiospirochaeta perfilievii TaxID=252967 RepID=A0A5C1QF93_9SPIO|nr:glutamate racemase [Thiospirochaeta perfilievii]QEN05790.1 glutamate racemase [Thiospirochaeta perfilievii]
MDKPIVVFDSGVGGLPYLVHLRNRFSWEDFVYIADNKNFPYGEKTEESLVQIISILVTNIIKRFNPKAIVVACNTASVTSLKYIRELTSIPIIGVVPAVKPASDITRNNKIGVLATKRTVRGQYLQDLINKFSPDKEVVLVGAGDIVNFVETKMYNLEQDEIKEYIRDQVEPFKKSGVDSIVLGCTHFIHVSDEIEEALGSGVKIIDSRDGVTRQVGRVTDIGKVRERVGTSSFFLTNSRDVDSYIVFCKKHNVEFKGEF